MTFYDKVALVSDRAAKRLRGLNLETGQQIWERDDDKAGHQRLIIETDATDRDQPGSWGNFAPFSGNTRRVIQLNADKSIRVIDLDSGAVIGTRSNVGDADAIYAAHDGTLYVADSKEGYQITAFNLDRLAEEPRSVYRSEGSDRAIGDEAMMPCGDGRLCVLDEKAGDDATTQLVVVDGKKGGRVWVEAAPEADVLIPVGDRVVAWSTSGEYGASLYEPNGKKRLELAGAIVRLNAGNVLTFDRQLNNSAGDQSISGLGVKADGNPTNLGVLRNIKGSRCSWNEKVIFCPSDSDFRAWRFAD